jgi:uncharacterized protein YbaR (Trm112 family)
MGKASHGPYAGEQPIVKYCPVCKGDLYVVRSNQRNLTDSHTYQCVVCDRVMEINIIDRIRDQEPQRVDIGD